MSYICLTNPCHMKTKLIALLVVLCQALPVIAQEETKDQITKSDGEIKTLFKKSDHKAEIGYYISPEGAYTQFKGRDVFLGGLSLGLMIDHFFSVGLAGYGILNSGNLWYDFEEPRPLDAPAGAYLYGGYGGVKFEFRILPSSPIHVNFPILIGGGGLVYNTWTYQNHNHDHYNYDGTTVDSDSFFVVEPGVMVELNLLKFMRVDAGISYRYTPDLDLMNTSAGLINNFNACLSLKFGKF
jgi:hypothetical protein